MLENIKLNLMVGTKPKNKKLKALTIKLNWLKAKRRLQWSYRVNIILIKGFKKC